mmetsp:Transcript_47216/g.131833  ORF Transcript_47216/g.131833 Transcript_47216/m.131833 type:complete len:89 (-) Transcript_47216:1104-1370(-)
MSGFAARLHLEVAERYLLRENVAAAREFGLVLQSPLSPPPPHVAARHHTAAVPMPPCPAPLAAKGGEGVEASPPRPARLSTRSVRRPP